GGGERGTRAAAPPAPVALERGGRITVLDTLTADELEEGRILEPEPHERGTLPPPAAETSKGEPLPLRRYYVAYAFSPRGAPGPVGTVAEFVLHQLPPPPAVVGASYTPAGVALTWEPSGGLLRFLLDQPLPDEPP